MDGWSIPSCSYTLHTQGLKAIWARGSSPCPLLDFKCPFQQNHSLIL